MARDYTQYEPSDALHLSSEKLGGTKYYLKDKAARAVLDSINDDAFAALQAGLGTVAGNDGKLVTAANIKSYVDQIAEIGFDVVKLTTLPEANATTYATYKNNIVLIPDAQAAAGSCIEYVILRSGTEGAYTYAWEQIGTTQVDLSNYVQKTTEIAGVQIGDGITKASLQSALELGNMAYVNQGTFTVGDYVNGVSSATTTASGTVELSESATSANLSKDDYTPEGTVTLNAFTQTPTSATLTKGDYTPQGEIDEISTINTGTFALPSVDVNEFNGGSLGDIEITAPGLSLEGDVTVGDTTNILVNGQLPSFDTTKFSGGSLGEASTASFTTNGIVASIDTSDSECLVFSNASTSSAVTAQGTFTPAALASDIFSQGTFPYIGNSELEDALSFSGNVSFDGSFSASAPDFQPASLGSDFFTEGSWDIYTFEPQFYGTTASSVLVTGVSYDKATANGATFNGSTVASALVTGVTYDKTTSATFIGSASDVTVTLSTTSKTVDVNPKTSA